MDPPIQEQQQGQQEPPKEEKQCRICLDGHDPALGRLIKPCLCKGTISYVHTGCLKLWMKHSAANNSAFYKCPQCGYAYRYGRTRVMGLSTNPVIVAALTSIVFSIIVILSSFVTTWLLGNLDESSSGGGLSWSWFSGYYYWISPYDVLKDLIRAVYRIMVDQDGWLDPDIFSSSTPSFSSSRRISPINQVVKSPPGILRRLFKRFVLGLPVVGAGSLIQMFISMPLLGPVQRLARFRGDQSRRNNQRDIAALVLIALMLVGIARAVWAVYRLTEKSIKLLLLRAEDIILEVR